jgi:hypothetical protein
MNSIKIAFAVAVLSQTVTGCAVTLTLPPYQISSSQSFGGAINRISATQTQKPNVAANQIRNTAVGNILLTEPVADYITNAVRLELRAAGVKMGTGPCALDLTVEDYAAEDLGFNVTYISNIRYRLSAATTLYDRQIEQRFTTDKFVVPELVLSSLQSVLAKNINEALSDANFQRAVATSCADQGRPVSMWPGGTDGERAG